MAVSPLRWVPEGVQMSKRPAEDAHPLLRILLRWPNLLQLFNRVPCTLTRPEMLVSLPSEK